MFLHCTSSNQNVVKTASHCAEYADWNIAGATNTPNGNLLYLNNPFGLLIDYQEIFAFFIHWQLQVY